jgi:hypothetical protein
MFGHGRGLKRGRFWLDTPVNVSEGYTYIGPCRCGFGPDAFYRNKNGRIVHAAHVRRRGIPTTPAAEGFEAEVGQLKAENREMEKRIRELEKRLETKERKP